MGLFQYRFDAADAGAGGFFFGNLKFTQLIGMRDVRAATNFNRNWILDIFRCITLTNSIYRNTIWITVAKTTVRVERIKGVIFVVFSKDYG